MALILYTFLLRLFSPLVWAWMGWRARRAGGLWQILGAERFGAYTQPWDGEAPVWVHAVSLGETRAAQSLVLDLVSRGDAVLLTHTTPTGRAEGARLFAAEIAAGQLRQQWLPYDFPGATQRFFAHYRPRLGVLIEREVWPNLTEQARLAGVPMVLASARFSETAKRHVTQIDWIFRTLMRDTYGKLDLVLAQTADDARRLFDVGVGNVQVTGNLKFDLPLPVVAVEAGRAWRERFNRPIVAIASTREGEDAMFVQALRQLASQQPGLDTQCVRPLFLLIPRHPQRFDEAAGWLDSAGLRYMRWSLIRHDARADQSLAEVQVILGDTLGEMPFFYAASDVAIVAGSFAPLGGQNLIEACAIGTPVIVGPHARNFADAVEGAVAAGAAIQLDLADGSDLAERALAIAQSWLKDSETLRIRARAARDWVAQHTGATRRILSEISDFEAARAKRERPRG